MTQLVQLQRALPVLRDAGFEVFAISNDTIERLAAFSDQHGIEFDLLADEESNVIQAFGIMNTLIRPDEGKHMRWYGIPYPGTFITNSSGVIVDKDFHQHHARRLSGRALIHRVLGTAPEPHTGAPATSDADDEISLTASLIDPTLRLEVLSVLTLDLRIAPGRHIYAPGAPGAFTPVSLTVRGKGVRVGDPAWPPAEELVMTQLNTSVPVYAGTVRITLPITATSELIRLGHGLEHGDASISISCTYQACDEHACGLPTTIETTLEIPLELLVEPPGIQSYAERVTREAENRAQSGGEAHEQNH